jgi:hypothetical protein
MADPQVRIFPHSKKEFPSVDHLRAWLLNGLRGRGGLYHLRAKDAVAELPPGSIVLFRYGKEIVGEAVVRKGKELIQLKAKDATQSGEEEEYEAQVTFAPSSICLYAPPLTEEQIQTQKNIITYKGAYVELDWMTYACILREVVSIGAFIS